MARIVIEPDELTVGQADEIETLTRNGIGQTLATVYVVLKAQEPNATLEDAKNLKSRDIELKESEDDDTERPNLEAK